MPLPLALLRPENHCLLRVGWILGGVATVKLKDYRLGLLQGTNLVSITAWYSPARDAGCGDSYLVRSLDGTLYHVPSRATIPKRPVSCSLLLSDTMTPNSRVT